MWTLLILILLVSFQEGDSFYSTFSSKQTFRGRRKGCGIRHYSSEEDTFEKQNVDNEKKNDSISWKNLSQETRDDIRTTAISFFVAITVRLLLIEPRFIPSLSMFPTFDIGDQLLVDKVFTKVSRNYQRRDVVVFNPPDAYVELTGTSRATFMLLALFLQCTHIMKNNNEHLCTLMYFLYYTLYN